MGSKGVFTGTPIRPALFQGEAEKGLAFTGFDGARPILLVMGGSQGAQAINQVLRQALPQLTRQFDIIHLCGKGKVDPGVESPAYRQYEYIGPELPHLFACTDIVLSRAGANAVFEFLALAKPALLVPLPLSASRGDQILNAGYFVRKGYAMSMEQEQLTPAALTDALTTLYENRQRFISAMRSDARADGTDAVLQVIRNALGE